MIKYLNSAKNEFHFFDITKEKEMVVYLDQINKGKNGIYCVDFKDINEIRKLFLAFSEAMDIPEYFEANWNVFDECINDLSWLKNKTHFLFLRNVFSFYLTDVDIFKIMIEILCGKLKYCVKNEIVFNVIIIDSKDYLKYLKQAVSAIDKSYTKALKKIMSTCNVFDIKPFHSRLSVLSSAAKDHALSEIQNNKININIRELKRILGKNKIHRGLYSFNKNYNDMSFCLNSTSNGWEVYYCERGEKFEYHRFNTEDEACRYFLNRLISTNVYL